MCAVAANLCGPSALPKLGRTALRRAQRKDTLQCQKLGSVVVAVTVKRIVIEKTESSGVFGFRCIVRLCSDMQIQGTISFSQKHFIG